MKLVQELRRSRQLMSLVSFPVSLERFGRGSVAWSDVCPTDIQEVTGLILQSGNILSWRLVMKSFLQPFSLDSSRAVTGKRMCLK